MVKVSKMPEGLRQSPTAKHHSEIPGQLLSSDNTRHMNAGQRVNHFRKEFKDKAQPKQANPWLKKMKEDLVLKREQDASF